MAVGFGMSLPVALGMGVVDLLDHLDVIDCLCLHTLLRFTLLVYCCFLLRKLMVYRTSL